MVVSPSKYFDKTPNRILLHKTNHRICNHYFFNTYNLYNSFIIICILKYKFYFYRRDIENMINYFRDLNF
eukprot:UN15456